MAKQIKNFNKTQLLLGTLTNFHKKVLTLIGTTTAAALHVEGLEPQYAAAVETLSSIVNRPTTYVATQSRQDVDDRRDRFVGVIHQIINAHKTNPIAEKQAAAATLGALMAMCGLAHVPFQKWFKFAWKLVAILSLVGVGFMLYAVYINYGPF